MDNEIWTYLDQLIEKDNEIINRGLVSILIFLKEDKINEKKSEFYLSKIGKNKSELLDANGVEWTLSYI
ncbi:MAG: hypothetical protein ACOCRK_10385 [bacterium]